MPRTDVLIRKEGLPLTLSVHIVMEKLTQLDSTQSHLGREVPYHLADWRLDLGLYIISRHERNQPLQKPLSLWYVDSSRKTEAK